ncbi:hypothetical protein H180DRAFT_05002 [Streptomyces sp. WMMB 322]|nr:hypothetical protein H180DRAFT_05002 [Streptomyces sp. WMMB 322]
MARTRAHGPAVRRARKIPRERSAQPRHATTRLSGPAEPAYTAAESAELPRPPLAAANAALPWPGEPHLVLWPVATVLLEHRGDGHLAAHC